MSFGLSMRDVPMVYGYEGAVDFYNNCDPWRGAKVDDERPLIGKRKRDTGVRMVGKDVVFRYHNHDVVTWKPNGTVQIDTYNSRSTCTFANNFTPIGVSLEKEGTILRVGDWLYPIKGVVDVDPNMVVEGSLGKFLKTTVNRKNARQFLATTKYAEYRAWHAVMSAMTEPPVWWRRAYLSRRDVSDKLNDQECWHELMMSNVGTPEQLRKTLYTWAPSAHCVWDQTYKDRLPRGTDLKTWKTT